MIDTSVITLEPLHLERLSEAVQLNGPCLTFRLPAYRPGTPSGSVRAILRELIKHANGLLTQRELPQEIRETLLEPVDALASDPELIEGSHWGRTILRCPGLIRQFQTLESRVSEVTVGGCFQIRPLLIELLAPSLFYTLKVSKKNVVLVQCSNLLAAIDVKLPKSIPPTLDDALAFRAPDHDLVNRSSAGPAVGNMRGVRFGTGTERESGRSHLAEFYRLVDRGLSDFLKQTKAPLVLAGVAEDTALYQTVNTYPQLVSKSIEGASGDPADRTELAGLAMKLLLEHAVDREANALAQARERFAPERYATGLSNILRSAAEGRVDRLYIEDAARSSGVFESIVTQYRSWGDEDLHNLAAVQTIRHGGKAFVLPPGRIPEGANAAALLRF